MPNQYSDNFEINVKAQFGKPAREVLCDCFKEGLSYIEAAEKTKQKIWTIKRWCRRYGISLTKSKAKHIQEITNLYTELHKDSINKVNIFSKKWIF